MSFPYGASVPPSVGMPGSKGFHSYGGMPGSKGFQSYGAMPGGKGQYHSYGAMPGGKGYQSYGTGNFQPGYGSKYPVPAGKKDLKDDDKIADEAQDETTELSKPNVGPSFLDGSFCGCPVKDLLAALLVFVGPLLTFMIVYGLVGFHFRFDYGWLAWILVLVVLAGVMAVGAGAFLCTQKESDDIRFRFSAYAIALLIGLLVAFITALGLGCVNYSHMKVNYEAEQLNKYEPTHGVNPSTSEGKAFQDAGTIQFSSASRLEMSKSIGFRNEDMYCVAPIVSSDKTKNYDFWAVGTNCCTGAANDFHCGDAVELQSGSAPWNMPGGIRLMSGSELPFYKLAVTQAASKYGIQAPHPIFVHFVKDINSALDGNGQWGTDNFFMCLLYFSIFMLFIVLGAALGTMYIRSKYA